MTLVVTLVAILMMTLMMTLVMTLVMTLAMAHLITLPLSLFALIVIILRIWT